jgi:hypothetical protein
MASVADPRYFVTAAYEIDLTGLYRPLYAWTIATNPLPSCDWIGARRPAQHFAGMPAVALLIVAVLVFLTRGIAESDFWLCITRWFGHS